MTWFACSTVPHTLTNMWWLQVNSCTRKKWNIAWVHQTCWERAVNIHPAARWTSLWSPKLPGNSEILQMIRGSMGRCGACEGIWSYTGIWPPSQTATKQSSKQVTGPNSSCISEHGKGLKTRCTGSVKTSHHNFTATCYRAGSPSVALADLLGHSGGCQSTQIDQRFPSAIPLDCN